MTAALADFTTLGLGGPARSFVSAATDADLIDAVKAADAAAEPALLIGGGSNLVISDAGFPGTVIHVNTRASATPAPTETVDVTVAAGEDWDDVVAAAVAEGLAGLESLSGIPGRAGATPIQNVGAYGREVAEVITRVRVYDRLEDQILVLENESAASPTARASSSRPGAVRGPRRDVPAARAGALMPVKYAELATELGIVLGERRASARSVRPCSRSAPARGWCSARAIRTPAAPARSSPTRLSPPPTLPRWRPPPLPARPGRVPSYDAGDGLVKVPAAWLIEHAGSPRATAPPHVPASPPSTPWPSSTPATRPPPTS